MPEAENGRERFTQTADDRSRDIGSKSLIGIGFVAERTSENHACEEHRSKSEHARHDVAPDYSSTQERIERYQHRGRQEDETVAA